MNEHISTDLIIDYAHGELRAEDDAFVHAHLATCSPCRAELDAEVAFAEALRADAVREEREFPGALRGAIWAAVDAERPPVVSRIAAFFRPMIALPVAAVAVALIVISAPFGNGTVQTGTRIDASYYLLAHAAQQAENPFTDRAGTTVMETSMLDGGSTASSDTTTAENAAPSVAAEIADATPGTLADVSLSGGLDIVR